ncbi:MAG: ComF family protein [Promethearchaeia archaeon]
MIDSKLIENLVYPAFSDIIFSSKSGPLHRIQGNQKEFIIKSRLEQLKIISNFYAYYLKKVIDLLNYDEIIPVPAKLIYTFNSVEIIGQEIGKIFGISLNSDRIRRIDNEEKDYHLLNKNENLSQFRILLIDDIITNGITKDKIYSILRKAGCNQIDMITLGRTDYNIYEYNE